MLGGRRRAAPRPAQRVCPRDQLAPRTHHGRADADIRRMDTGRPQTGHRHTPHRTRDHGHMDIGHVGHRTRWTPDAWTPDWATSSLGSSRTSSTTPHEDDPLGHRYQWMRRLRARNQMTARRWGHCHGHWNHGSDQAAARCRSTVQDAPWRTALLGRLRVERRAARWWPSGIRGRVERWFVALIGTALSLTVRCWVRLCISRRRVTPSGALRAIYSTARPRFWRGLRSAAPAVAMSSCRPRHLAWCRMVTVVVHATRDPGPAQLDIPMTGVTSERVGWGWLRVWSQPVSWSAGRGLLMW
jgi:hypothetical protein